MLVGLILKRLQKTPTLSTVQLLAALAWHEMGEQLSQTGLKKEWLLNIPDANLEQQFSTPLTVLLARQTERRIEQLLDNQRIRPLTTEEKQQTARAPAPAAPAHASGSKSDQSYRLPNCFTA